MNIPFIKIKKLKKLKKLKKKKKNEHSYEKIIIKKLHEHNNKADRKKLELCFLPWKLVEPLARPRPSDGKSFAKPFFVGPLLLFLVSLSLSLFDILFFKKLLN